MGHQKVGYPERCGAQCVAFGLWDRVSQIFHVLNLGRPEADARSQTLNQVHHPWRLEQVLTLKEFGKISAADVHGPELHDILNDKRKRNNRAVPRVARLAFRIACRCRNANPKQNQ